MRRIKISPKSIKINQIWRYKEYRKYGKYCNNFCKGRFSFHTSNSYKYKISLFPCSSSQLQITESEIDHIILYTIKNFCHLLFALFSVQI
jgi:hypothetical protein